MKRILKHPIYAHHGADKITVYQAYNRAIGEAAAIAGTLDVPAFSKTRMTWIKPSFLWMMYRAGWGEKNENQSTILRITMTRAGFCKLLLNSCLSSFDPKVYDVQDAWREDLRNRPNRVQWDPDKDVHLRPLEQRAIQIGIAQPFVAEYVGDWIIQIEDITAEAQRIKALVAINEIERASDMMLAETEIEQNWLQAN